MKKKSEELIDNIIQWGKERGLLDEALVPKQYLKFLEEVGETARAILKDQRDEVIDGFGDIAVTMIILAAQQGKTYSMVETPVIMDIELYEVVRRVSPDGFNSSALNFLNDAAAKYNLNLLDCMEVAYNVIKDRKGKMVNGTFVKEA